MRFSGLILKGFQQFNNVQLDFRDPQTGKAAEKLCIIGPNGTGKSTILRCLHEFLHAMPVPPNISIGKEQWFVAARIEAGDANYWAIQSHQFRSEAARFGKLIGISLYRSSIEEDDEWINLMRNSNLSAVPKGSFTKHRITELPGGLLENNSSDVVVYLPSDGAATLPQDPPNTNYSNALALAKEFPYSHRIGTQNVVGFWNMLIFLIKKRDSDYQEFLKRPEVRTQSVMEAEKLFAASNPEILPRIAELWNAILEPAGLEFDVAGAKIPIQLNENLSAHVRVKKTGNPLSYNSLSTGIRNFLFTLGHIYAIYFRRNIQRGFALIDEPENSLYPNLLYDLINVYSRIMPNTQMFFATHSPIIASQFKPHERVLLDFDENADVIARRGVTPVGDDPNDVLSKDFNFTHLYGPEGERMWDRFLELRKLIKNEPSESKRVGYAAEYSKIGNAYGFTIEDALPGKDSQFTHT